MDKDKIRKIIRKHSKETYILLFFGMELVLFPIFMASFFVASLSANIWFIACLGILCRFGTMIEREILLRSIERGESKEVANAIKIYLGIEK